MFRIEGASPFHGGRGVVPMLLMLPQPISEQWLCRWPICVLEREILTISGDRVKGRT